MLRRYWPLAVAAVLALALLVIAADVGTRPRHDALHAVPKTLRALAAAVAVFGSAGLGLTRLLLPERLRPYEWLWVLPVGASASGLALTVLGFCAVPFAASLAIVLAGGVVLGVIAVRRRGWPAGGLPRLGWPAYIAVLVCGLALMPMLMKVHIATVVGNGSDAHVAAGSAHFLQHSYPTSVNVSEPIDQMPPEWGSKYPIYYAFGAVAEVSGLQTYETLAPLAAVLLALAALGMFLLAREVLRAPEWVALAAMGLAGIDREVLATGLHPYFNQTWGYFAMPFAFVLGRWLIQPEGRRGAAILFVLFMLTLGLAYPLAAPIPLLALLVHLRLERVRLPSVRRLWHGPRSLVWMAPVGFALLLPVGAAVAKGVGAAGVVFGHGSLKQWGGDLTGFVPDAYFLSMPRNGLGALGAIVMLWLAIRMLRRLPGPVGWGLGSVLLFGLLAAQSFEHRQYGYYFHFKILAFVAPLVVVCAAAGAGTLRRAGPLILCALAAAFLIAARTEIDGTGEQLGKQTLELAGWTRGLPPDASIRLDMRPGEQLWAGYLLSARRLCSQHPLVNTDYPHVPVSRKADYIVSSVPFGHPRDAVGAPLRLNDGYRLWRMRPGVPGPDRCSKRVQSRVIGNSKV